MGRDTPIQARNHGHVGDRCCIAPRDLGLYLGWRSYAAAAAAAVVAASVAVGLESRCSTLVALPLAKEVSQEVLGSFGSR